MLPFLMNFFETCTRAFICLRITLNDEPPVPKNNHVVSQEVVSVVKKQHPESGVGFSKNHSKLPVKI